MGIHKGIDVHLERIKSYLPIIIVVIVSFVLFHFAYMFEVSFDRIISIATYLTWHNLFEFTGVVISFAVFVVSYYAYDQSRYIRSFLIGNIFLVMGIIDAFHALSFKGMPDFFISNNAANRATTFWIVSRLIGGIGLASVSFIPLKKRYAVNKRLIVIPSILLCIVCLIVATYFPQLLPAMYIEGYGLTQTKIMMEYVIVTTLTVALANFLREFKRVRESLTILMCCSLILSIFSEFAFISYGSVYDIYNYLGHVYKFIAFFLIFRVIFIYNVQKPYSELSKAQRELKNYAENLDRIVDQRTREIKEMNQILLDDLDYARDIQKAMLPSLLPDNRHISFEARYFPTDRVSGDFYNIFNIDENNIGMYIGDVSGHGVPAAMLTVFINQCILNLKEIDQSNKKILSPSTVLKSTYKAFNKTNFKDDVYIVLLYAVYNTETMELTIASGGLNTQPLLINSSGDVTEISIKGFPICKFMDFYTEDYIDTTIKLDHGDRILFYTDGLVEAEIHKGERFNENNLKQLIAANGRKAIMALSELITRTIFDFVGVKKTRDDITFFIMQVK
ncbi:MAG: SpoIIE family protein phosphatase [Clostridia bacterium]|nr:SpoIIE family protein phosphatase [Clostridia bacterium]